MEITSLTKLSELREQGVLSEEAFQQEQAKILAQMATPIQRPAEHQPVVKKSLFRYFWECIFSIKYFSIKGRARRREYWGFALFKFLITFGLLGYLIWSVVTAILNFEQDPDFSVQVNLFTGFYIAMIIPSLTVCARRLHDVNISGWWISPTILWELFLAYEMLTTDPNQPYPDNDISTMAVIALLILFVLKMIVALFTLVVSFMASNPFENKYGPVPPGIKQLSRHIVSGQGVSNS